MVAEKQTNKQSPVKSYCFTSSGGHLCCCHLYPCRHSRMLVAPHRGTVQRQNYWMEHTQTLLLTFCLTCEIKTHSPGNRDGEGWKQTIFRIASLKSMGESRFIVPPCGQAFYGLNAGIVKGQGTQAKRMKRLCVCVSFTVPLLCTRPECFSWFCVTVLCATFL